MENHNEFKEQKDLMILAQIDGDELNARYDAFSHVDDEQTLQRIRERVNIKNPTAGRHFLRYAAAVLVLLVAGAGYWYKQYTKVIPPEIPETVQMAIQQSMQNGKADAVIDERFVMSDEDDASGSNQQEQGYVAPQSSSTSSHHSILAAHPSLTKEQLLKARRITTRHDKEFWLTLDDGTLVHLNYNTRLIYPEEFGRGDRNVILDGEAYFMVAKDKSRPFIVHTSQGDIRVYGTEFNVNTKNSTASTAVVLVKGSVGVKPSGGKEYMLKPGEQGMMGDNGCKIEEVDLEPYIAWNIGKFSFEEWPLERIMQVISRWYGREVEFTSEDIKHQRYSGNFDRYEDIHPTMEAIEIITGLKITFAPGKLIIEP